MTMKPTGRLTTFIVTALLLYFAANQTQVNWLYVMAALIAGVIPAAWWLNRVALRGLEGERRMGDDDGTDLHEGDSFDVSLILRASQRNLAQVTFTEVCPLAPPDAEEHSMTVFAPRITREAPAILNYTTTIYQRGLYSFPNVQLATRVPFGLFQQQGTLTVSSDVLVYPEIRPLERLSLLDRQPAAYLVNNRAGMGNEVLGVRGYQPGDSPRHIHWRSVARTGRLVSKEFAEETQPGVSIVLDRYLPPTQGQHAKHNPFEWSVKAAVSIAEYAYRRHYPLHLHADPAGTPTPHGAVTWDALMQYSARVGSRRERRLPALLEAGGFRPFVAVIVSTPDADLLAPLVGLKNSGARVMVVVVNPTTFPMGGDAGGWLVDALRAEDIDAHELRYGEDWAVQLSEEG
jgi:uncharacterized protein (DUF58 family)